MNKKYMKLILAFLVFLLSCASVWCWRVAQEYKGVRFAVYMYGGYPVWSEKDRLQIQNNSSTSSKTITTADFVNIEISTTQKAIIEAAYPGGKWVGPFPWYKHETIRAEDVEKLLKEKSP